MDGRHAAPARRPWVRRALLAACLLLVAYVYWRWMLRWFFPQRDDFWLVSVSDDPYGRFGIGDFLWSWWNDWMNRNGRSADAVVRALLRPGTEATSWILPAVLSVCSAAAWRWLPTGDRPAARWAARVAMMCVVPVALQVAPSIAGNTVFWAAGFGNYVVPTALALLASSWFGRPPARTPLRLAVLSILAAGLLHELAGLTVVAVASVWWLVHRADLRRRDAVLLGAAWVGFVLGMAGPGRWQRLEALAGDETGLVRWVSAAARYLSELLLQTWPVWATLLVVLALAVAAVWGRSTVLQRRRLLATVLTAVTAGVAAHLLARAWRSDPQRCSQVAPLADGHTLPAVLMLLSAGVTVVAVAALFVQLRPHVGEAPLLLGAGLLGTLPLPMVTGQCAPRVWYPSLVWAMTLVVVVLALLVRGAVLPAAAIVAAAVVGAVLALRFAAMAEPALRANHESFRSVLEQIPATRTTGTGTIVFPEEVPFPQFGKEPVYRLPSIACGFRDYYDVPSGVILDDGTAPRAGLPDYCPRPDTPRRP